MKRQRISLRSPSVSRLGSELSAVINRVRSAFGSISMSGPAACAEIKQAEQVVDQTACQMLRGEADLSTWYRILRQYEQPGCSSWKARATDQPSAAPLDFILGVIPSCLQRNLRVADPLPRGLPRGSSLFHWH